MTTILGLNAFHGDASACLVRDGVLIAAAEEERFCRVKHYAGFPAAAIRYCLAEAGIGLGDVAHVAINQDGSANLAKKLAYVVTRRPDLGLILERIRNKKERRGIAQHLEDHLGVPYHGQVHEIEHHLCHLASAYYVGPFESAVAVSIDGFGDFASAGWGYGSGNKLEMTERIHFPHSLGIFYQAMTQYLGFPNYGDEYKLMGLAPYGEPVHLQAMRDIVRLLPGGQFELNLDYFRHHQEKIDYQWEQGEPVVGQLYAEALAERFGPARGASDELTQHHKDLARSTQAMYEEAFLHVLESAYAAYPSPNLVLAGGCAMNSVANGKVTTQSKFRHLYVQSAAGDAGGAIGAAFEVWHRLNKAAPTHCAPSVLGDGKLSGRFVMDHAYWGPGFDDANISGLLETHAARLKEAQCTVTRIADEQTLLDLAASTIADGKVLGWFQGRMEWGPRALGNRSILCDPRRADMKDILNRKIKRRESFRPFAPSILRESVADWFEVDDDVPFMMQVYRIREAQRARIPAVTHVDGTGRLQTVYAKTNSRYYGVIAAFRKLTGVPMVLNTSFNENEPVVCQPAEALDCFLRTHMDSLIIGNWHIQR